MTFPQFLCLVVAGLSLPVVLTVADAIHMLASARAHAIRMAAERERDCSDDKWGAEV
jgi:mannose/fructose-specific phosphotransferase system component IIA